MAQPLILAASTITIPWLGLVVGVIFPLIGLILLVKGFRGKRVGDDPHCQRCKYNLTGLPSNRCPECGAHLDASKAVTTGQRRRCKGSLAVGIILLLFATGFWGTTAYIRAKNIDLYKFYPASWLIDMAAGNDGKAYIQLNNRYFAGKLSDAEIDKFITKGLEIQGAESKHNLSTPWITLLSQMILIGQATQEQKTTFYRQLARYHIKVRSPIRAGEPFVMYTTPDFRCPESQKPANIRFPAYVCGRTVTAGEHVILKQSASSFSRETISDSYGGSSTWPFDNVTQDIPPGRYEVINSGTLKVFAPDIGRQTRHIDPDTEEPLAVTEIRSACEIEILPADSQELVKLIDRPDLKDRLHDMIKIRPVEVRHRQWLTRKNKVEVSMEVHLVQGTTLPIGVAFDVVVRIGNAEHRLAGLNCRKGKRISRSTGSSMPAFDEEMVTIILRGSRDVAKRSLDLYEIWDGELVYEGIPVERWPGR